MQYIPMVDFVSSMARIVEACCPEADLKDSALVHTNRFADRVISPEAEYVFIPVFWCSDAAVVVLIDFHVCFRF